MAVIENDVVMKFKDSSGNVNLLYPITRADNVDGLQEAIRNQSVVTKGTGAVYTATVAGITSLSAGVSFVMIPHTVSTTSSPKLNVNGLGEKLIKRRVSNCTGTFYNASAPSDWLTAGKPITVTYDGEYWIADLPVPNANDIMGAVPIANGGTGATTATQARINLGIETTDGTVSSGNENYAEVGEWIDGNPDAEDRIGYFICIDSDSPGTTMRKATSSDDVRGVTVASPAFAGGCSSDKYAQAESSDTEVDPDADSRAGLLPQYDYVAVMGIVPVIDDGTCVVNGRCMPNASGIATSVSGDYGYHVMDRIDETHVLIAVEPGTDFQYKLANTALYKSGGTMTGALAMGGNIITGLGAPEDSADAATKEYVDVSVTKAAPVNLLHNSDFTRLVAPYGYLAGKDGRLYLAEKWPITANAPSYNPDSREITFNAAGLSIIDQAVEWDIAGKTVTLAINARSVNGAVALTEHNAQSGHANVPINTGITVHTFVGGDDTLVRVFSSSGASIVIDWMVLYEGEYTVDTLPGFRPRGYMLEALNCGALRVVKLATLSTNWAGDAAPYSQTITVAGILSSDFPHIAPVYSGDFATAVAEREAWSAINTAASVDGAITFVCFEEKPTTAITVLIEVMH